MTDNLYKTARALWDSASIVLIVIILYVAYLAPLLVLRGEADRKLTYVAGALGMAFWAFGIVSISKVIG